MQGIPFIKTEAEAFQRTIGQRGEEDSSWKRFLGRKIVK
jgi:hypothetical protein